jgi:hypothetical protein
MGMGSVTLNEAARYRFDSFGATLEFRSFAHIVNFYLTPWPSVATDRGNMRAPPLSLRKFMA